MMQQIKKFLRDEEGATAVEYGLIVGLIAVALVLVLSQVGGTANSGLMGLFTTVKTKLDGVTTGSSGS